MKNARVVRVEEAGTAGETGIESGDVARLWVRPPSRNRANVVGTPPSAPVAAFVQWVLNYHLGRNRKERAMMQIAPRIVLDEPIQAGKPVIAGTRVPVEVILGVLAAGESMERIMGEHRIQKEDILAAIACAARVVSGEDIREVS